MPALYPTFSHLLGESQSDVSYEVVHVERVCLELQAKPRFLSVTTQIRTNQHHKIKEFILSDNMSKISYHGFFIHYNL